MADADRYDLHLKLLMLGDTGVGKTRGAGAAASFGGVAARADVAPGFRCLLLRYAFDSFSPTFITTIGIDFKIKEVRRSSLPAAGPDARARRRGAPPSGRPAQVELDGLRARTRRPGRRREDNGGAHPRTL